MFEDTDLFQRTSGAGSDVVQKEMYTFEDKGGRALTLRPEATAPICRAYIEHGMHREPQPVKLYTVAPMYRYAAPQRGRYREHWQLSIEAIGTADPAIDAEVIQLYTELLRRLGVTRWELLLNSIGDRNCRPAYIEKLNAWLDEHDDVARRRCSRKACDEPAARLRRQERARARGAPRRADDRRVALRGVRRALRARSRVSRCVRRPVHDRPDARPRARLLHADNVRVHRAGREHAGLDDLRRRPLRLSGRGDRRPADARASASAPASSGSFSRSSSRGSPASTAARCRPRRDGDADRTEILRTLAELRERGIACDTDYAGRSMKGQLTQAQKRANAVAIRTADGWTLRRRGEEDRQAATLGELL